MECKKYNFGTVTSENKWSFIKLRKLTSLETIYAGLLLCFVPSVICESAWPERLTYEQIYNTTSYAQIQYASQPYTPVTPSHSHNHRFSYNTKWNEVDYPEEKTKLLVGFARDPFRYSIPEEDYRRGVRTVNPQSYKNENRGKRGVFHLYNMLMCANGCDPLSYKGYGCYCGFLGSGRPTDGIDRCCQMHDKCYENIYCPFFTVYFQPYYWKCWHGEPLCALENYHTQDQLVNGCAGRLCECDRQFAMCVKRYTCPRGRALCRSSPLRLLQNILMFR